MALHLVCVMGKSQLEAASAVGVSQRAISRLLQRVPVAEGDGAADESSGAALAETPIANKKRRSNGRPSLLTPDAATQIVAAFKEDPVGRRGRGEKGAVAARH